MQKGLSTTENLFRKKLCGFIPHLHLESLFHNSGPLSLTKDHLGLVHLKYWLEQFNCNHRGKSKKYAHLAKSGHFGEIVPRDNGLIALQT